ncbi:MAG: alpha/beta hydrolase fold domain-containing protein [Chlorobi bacterium]|nr:alpha/beta hydrolase fold domain-containing protein [Chlorobiota bacterium]
MKLKNAIFFLHVVLTTTLFGQSWGTQVFQNAETTYDIYKKNFSYADSTFLITDIRDDSVAAEINSFNIQNLSVFRAYDGANFLPNQPVIFFVHGGGWTDGYASMYDFVSLSLTGEKGWTVVNVDYRLTSDSVFIADEYCPDRLTCFDTLNRKKAAWYPDNLNDAAGAFKWTLENISENGGDTSKVFIFGHSAGAHIAALFSVHPNFENLRNYIKGSVCMSGGYEVKTLNAPTFASSVNQTFHGGYTNNDAELDEASPITYVESGTSLPPFYLLHSQFDLLSLAQQKILFFNKLSLFGFDVEQDYLPGYNHVSEISVFSQIDSLPVKLVTEYIQKRLDILSYIPDDETPREFELKQNFPNPFFKNSEGNGTTTIKYSIPIAGDNFTSETAKVILKVYDVLGREVATLVNKEQTPGAYEIVFNAANLPSGIYFYSLTAGNFIRAKKMIFIR